MVFLTIFYIYKFIACQKLKFTTVQECVIENWARVLQKFDDNAIYTHDFISFNYGEIIMATDPC